MLSRFKSDTNPQFRTSLAESVFNAKYRHQGCETWAQLAKTLAYDVCSGILKRSEVEAIRREIEAMRFIPGGRYLYYAGRPIKAFQNCYLLRSEEDTREDWAMTSWKAESCLATGGGIGNDYSVYRPRGTPLKRTGGVASGPISKMKMINEIGREVQQGGSRRSAIYASLNWQHQDVPEFMTVKNWDEIKVPGTRVTLKQAKEADFNFPAPLDMTNISLNYDTAWVDEYFKTGQPGRIFLQNTEQALRTGEPGFSFNFWDKERETLRNACCEVTSEDDSDVCNLGSINLSRIESLEQFRQVVQLATKFLMCGSLRGTLPYQKVYEVREKNQRIGLGLMGVHEWLLKRGERYEVTVELHNWLYTYMRESDVTAKAFATELGIQTPVAKRSIAPTGTIGIIAGTTTGIEPVFAVAYRRRYLKRGRGWVAQWCVDATAQTLIDECGVAPDKIETALDLAADPERRIRFQADVQDYVDMAISSTINLPAWGTELNNPDKVEPFARILAHYAPRLRGFTAYPDGARGGQPLTSVSYDEAVVMGDVEFEDNDACKGGVCGI